VSLTAFLCFFAPRRERPAIAQHPDIVMQSYVWIPAVKLLDFSRSCPPWEASAKQLGGNVVTLVTGEGSPMRAHTCGGYGGPHRCLARLHTGSGGRAPHNTVRREPNGRWSGSDRALHLDSPMRPVQSIELRRAFVAPFRLGLHFVWPPRSSPPWATKCAVAPSANAHVAT
jgi:hypothetical protein